MMMGGVADNAAREAPVYYVVKAGATFATAMMEEGGSRREEEEGEGGEETVVWTMTMKATEDGVGWGAVTATA